MKKDFQSKVEGGLFVCITMTSIYASSFIFRKDWYAVINGEVYEVGDGRKIKTGDTLFDLIDDCKRVGRYNPAKRYRTLDKMFTYKEVKKLLKF